MKYKSGEIILVGDQILIENGKTKGKVNSVISSHEDMENNGVKEAGVMIESEPFGLVFWPIDEEEDPIVFVSR